MKRKLNCVLLIDDDESTNFYHELVIREAECAEKVVAVQSGKAALDFLQAEEQGQYPQPDLILLDINMPAMNGWEFLEAYRSLAINIRGRIIIIMLTASLNPDDETRARTIPEIKGFKNKPLTTETLTEILEQYFTD